VSTRRTYGAAALLLAAGLGLAGCANSADADTTPPEMASVSTPDGGGPGVVTLVQEAAKRLDIRTAPVAAGPGGLVMPYSALIYEPDGSSWVYVQTKQLTYQRAPITISSISGDQITATSGPQPGTQVVSQGAAELVGVETGIDGEE
jgi:multidrug efflux pump subunit AcrA (membrane-fusion protein)